MDIITDILSSLGAWGWIAVIVVILFRPEIVTRVLDFLPKKNGNGSHRIEELEDHAKVANEEMGEVKESLVALNTKVDIIMRHLKI